ncbi:MAG: DUF364 domain-containing protein [Oscillospiraceae bacterium]|nr:DUF364 domain-containing protein [Oscillospiraceae bacterium]
MSNTAEPRHITEYYELLQSGLPDGIRICELVHGISWTAAVLDNGRCGVAMHTSGETVPRMFDTLAGRSLRDAGQALMSWNMEEASEALAAVNAWYNHEDCGFLAPDARTLDGICLDGKTVGMVGQMIGHSNITRELLAPARELYIMDREEKPGAMPDSACEYVLPLCEVVIITGSAAINKTLPRLLELSRDAQVILTGPSVTCCPELLGLGIDCLHGRVITRKEAMLRAIVEKRTSVNAYSVSFLLASV